MATAVRKAKKTFYHPELDVLRFGAFFAVFLTHGLPHYAEDYARYHLPHPLVILAIAVSRAGRFGVPLFFLLSAYLITSLLLWEQHETGDVHLKSFYVRRILRIWPLYFFALTVAAVWPLKAERLPLNYLWGYLLLAGNWMSVILGAPASFVSILWSISIEEQFYLVWPMAVKSLRRKAIIYTAVALIILANGVRFYLAARGVGASAVYANTFVHLDSIAFGILCALFLPPSLRVPRIPLLLVGTALWLVCGYYYETQTSNFTRLAFPAISLGALAIFLSIYGLKVRNKFFPELGKISYGLYVYHFFALYVMGLLRFHLIAHFAGGLALTWILAAASYRWLESPFLRTKERFAFVRSRPV